MDPLPAIARFFAERGYLTETPRFGAALFVTKRGRSAGIFLPYVDFVFVHALDDGRSGTTDAQAFESLHQDARRFAESRFRLPRALRYRIPNVVTIAVSQDAPTSGMIAVAERSRQRLQSWGGAKDSVYLLDMAGRRLHSAGLERNPGPHGSGNTSSVNPTNRVFRLLTGFCEELFGSS